MSGRSSLLTLPVAVDTDGHVLANGTWPCMRVDICLCEISPNGVPKYSILLSTTSKKSVWNTKAKSSVGTILAFTRQT